MSIDAAPVVEQSRVARLAKQLELDIRRRRLRQGDSYRPPTVSAQLLGISRMTANRAMNVLANRQLLVRHRSRGTFVGPAVQELGGDAAEGSNSMGASKCVHYLTLIDHSPAMQLPLGEIVEGLQTSFPDVSLKTHTVPLRTPSTCASRDRTSR